jgi:hypothetical protein
MTAEDETGGYSLMTTVKKAWESYAAQVLPKEAPAVQVIECRRAFYAGAYSLGVTMTQEVSELPDREAMAAITALRLECSEFLDAVVEGKA